ncbi:mucoidy inhibitor MuiA family protein [Maribacter chungangensis]|uniref:Mucoidy inhibitor MuiA family protein n=1 Tax=Maribacter chungangensis TaxID=1069117 RepID=A0ABW3B3C5_9FLAO
MKTIYLLLCLCPLFIFGNDKKISSEIKEVTVYLNGANITRVAKCNLRKGTSEITLTGLSTRIEESSIQISGLQSVSILSMSYDLNFMPVVLNEGSSEPLQEQLDAITFEVAQHKNLISGLEEEEQVIYANRGISGRAKDLNLQQMKDISTYYRTRVTAIKNEIFETNMKIKKLNDKGRTLQKQMAALNNVPEKEQGELKIKFDAPIASNLNLLVSYHIQDAGWIPNYDIKSKDINTPLYLSYKAHVFQKTGNDWNNVTITLSTGNPNINVAKPNLGTKYLNFTNGYQPTGPNITKRNRYIFNPTIKQVTGTVVDQSGIPLPGVSIVLKGTTNGTQTDFDGHFSLDVQNGQELVASYIGQRTQQVPVYSSVMNIRMEEDESALEEVVVTAMGTSRDTRSLGYAVSNVGSDMLSGRAAGLQVGNGTRIRGISSIRTNASPLYVVDGVPLSDFEEGDLDMDEIQSVEVLKGASAMQLYGSRGVNGIMVITTKKSRTQDDVTNTRFIIKKPYSIASDGDVTAIEISTFTLNAVYEYFAAPIVNENVFLTTRFSDWEQYNLLPGEASVYFKGTYAGKTTIDPYVTKKEMTVSLGIDQNISVTRKQNRDFKNKSFTGSNRILDRTYDLEVKNNKATAIALKLMDRVPISQNNAIKVSDIETPNAHYDDKKGLVTWRMNLKQKETQKESFSFRVKYPKEKRISL